jgi:tRNA U38,U39,U40 pseudouridine synthase TruA
VRIWFKSYYKRQLNGISVQEEIERALRWFFQHDEIKFMEVAAPHAGVHAFAPVCPLIYPDKFSSFEES